MSEGDRTIGWHYEEARRRIDDLVRSSPAGAWETPVPACPGWRVRDVIAHLYGSTEDAAAGRLTGPPTEALTAEQVARHGEEAVPDLLDAWAAVSPLVSAAVTQAGMWPAAIDAVTHEHDLRTALDRPGARDHESVATIAGLLADGLRAAPVPVDVDVGGPAGGGTAALRLRTTAFELLRLRLGRRSRRQALALDWSDDPTPALPHLFVFGPSPLDQIE